MEVLSSLAYLCLKMGDWKEGKKYLKKAAKALKTTSSDAMLVSHGLPTRLYVHYTRPCVKKKGVLTLKEGA